MLRFLTLTWDAADPDAAATVDGFRDRIEGWAPPWRPTVVGSRLAAFVFASERHGDVLEIARPIHGSDSHDVTVSRDGGVDTPRLVPDGVVFGMLFDRLGAPVAALDAAAQRAVVTSNGGRLIERFWGSWAAISSGPTGGAALRAPGGSLRCFHVRRRSVDIWFSDVEDAARLLGEPFGLDVRAVAMHLAHRHHVANTTGLEGVSEVLGGQRLVVESGRMTWDWPWRPGEAWRASRIDDEDAAAATLRATVQETVSARASRHRRIVHRLSGGLDSSIVLGCLARAPSRPEVVALNYFMPPALFGGLAEPASSGAAASGDERRYARLAAAAAGCPLVERERRVEAIDLPGLVAARRTARPSGLAFSVDLDRMDVEVVRELDADAVFTGRGGDGVFFAARSTWTAIDEAWAQGLRPRLVPLILEAGRAGRRSAWSVLGRVVTQGLLHRPAPTAPADMLALLHGDAAALVTEADPRPPWAPLCEGLPPGKQEQVHAYFSGHRYAETFELGRIAAVIDPLQSQPVIETVLRIPTDVLTAGGSRGLARRAFADVLPDEIRRRTSKGAGDSFNARVVRASASRIREPLLDGALVNLGLLDRSAVEAGLAAHVARGDRGGALLHLVGVEAWARSWLGEPSALAR